MVTLKKNQELDEQLLTHIQRGIDQPTQESHRTAAPKNPRRFYWWVLPLLILTAGGLSWMHFQPQGITYPLAQQIQPNPAAAGSWQPLPALTPDTIVTASHAPLQIELPSLQRLTLATASTLELPPEPTMPAVLSQGSVQIDRFGNSDISLAVSSLSGTFDATASATITRNRFCDRLMISAGEVTWQRHDQLFMTLGQGASYDIARTPRLLTPLLRSYLPLTIDSSSPLSENQLERLPPPTQLLNEIQENTLAASRTASSHAPIQAPFMAPPAYDLRWQVVRRSGQASLALVIPLMSGTPSIIMLDGWESTRHGFQLLGGPQDNDNPTMVHYPNILNQNQSITVDVRVRPHVVAVYIDGHLLSWETPAEQQALGEVLWPPLPAENANAAAMVIPREDTFDVLRLECRVHADGVGANSHMYGLQ